MHCIIIQYHIGLNFVKCCAISTYVCVFLGFTQKQALHRHERIHSGDKPFKCALCSRTFNDYSIIRRHMIMLHKRDSKDPNNWKHDIVCTMKRKSDFYIEGGPGYNSGDRVPTSEPNTSNTELTSDDGVASAMKTLDDDLCQNEDTTDKNLGSGYGMVNSEKIVIGVESSDHTKQIYEEQESLHTLSRAAFGNEKDVRTEQTNSPNLPINYSMPADYSGTVRSRTEADEELVRYQNMSGVNPSGLMVPTLPPMASPDQLRQMPVTTTESGHPQTLQWSYPGSGYPYYNSATFSPYQGPSSS